MAGEGRKFDIGKSEYGLLPPYALEETVKVLTFGAQKYERGNWIKVPDAKRRYFDALQRHIWAWHRGEKNDPESNLHHLAHAMCCLMFLYEHDTIYNQMDTQQDFTFWSKFLNEADQDAAYEKPYNPSKLHNGDVNENLK